MVLKKLSEIKGQKLNIWNEATAKDTNKIPELHLFEINNDKQNQFTSKEPVWVDSKVFLEYSNKSFEIWSKILNCEVYHTIFGNGKIENVYCQSGNENVYFDVRFDVLKKFEISGFERGFISKILIDRRIFEEIRADNINKDTNMEINKETILNIIKVNREFTNVNYKKIKSFVNQRNIENLYHFTQVENIESIIENGLLSVKLLNENHVFAKRNDSKRLDRQEEAICLSISFPNYKYLYKQKQQHPEKKWVIIELSSKILWEKHCAFCITNAASSSVTGIPIKNRIGVEALKALFSEQLGDKRRDALNIPYNYTTDPQAEVLVFDIIEPQYIKAIYCNDPLLFINLYNLISKGYKIIYDGKYFSNRNDWTYW